MHSVEINLKADLLCDVRFADERSVRASLRFTGELADQQLTVTIGPAFKTKWYEPDQIDPRRVRGMSFEQQGRSPYRQGPGYPPVMASQHGAMTLQGGRVLGHMNAVSVHPSHVASQFMGRGYVPHMHPQQASPISQMGYPPAFIQPGRYVQGQGFAGTTELMPNLNQPSPAHITQHGVYKPDGQAKQESKEEGPQSKPPAEETLDGPLDSPKDHVRGWAGKVQVSLPTPSPKKHALSGSPSPHKNSLPGTPSPVKKSLLTDRDESPVKARGSRKPATNSKIQEAKIEKAKADPQPAPGGGIQQLEKEAVAVYSEKEAPKPVAAPTKAVESNTMTPKTEQTPGKDKHPELRAEGATPVEKPKPTRLNAAQSIEPAAAAEITVLTTDTKHERKPSKFTEEEIKGRKQASRRIPTPLDPRKMKMRTATSAPGSVAESPGPSRTAESGRSTPVDSLALDEMPNNNSSWAEDCSKSSSSGTIIITPSASSDASPPAQRRTQRLQAENVAQGKGLEKVDAEASTLSKAGAADATSSTSQSTDGASNKGKKLKQLVIAELQAENGRESRQSDQSAADSVNGTKEPGA